ncbi:MULTISPECIES: transcription elongation factor subunit Spt4 [Acidianus]|uniref:Transcription elongation factor Spt4 n=1 Tax=Candidatus Acidianus copahuensis TaxID=1160895 RepID=A0A031LMK4_9CREN|nr:MULTISPECIES: transcription elongation factor subunit Spt4 [Acidianus]EZQ03115.1 DNA-binding protein [Candidatus Acidianus copahuensis]NON61512.1 DNA-directed RNA polymerase, subunit E'' [Acidianus sp. RZ1]
MPSSSVFKACKNCKALVPLEQDICPVCGGNSFAKDWDGMIIIVSEKSELANLIEAKKPWRYAINLK